MRVETTGSGFSEDLKIARADDEQAIETGTATLVSFRIMRRLDRATVTWNVPAHYVELEEPMQGNTPVTDLPAMASFLERWLWRIHNPLGLHSYQTKFCDAIDDTKEAAFAMDPQSFCNY